MLQQRKKAEEEEERWRERQRQREKRLQGLVLKRAQANDPHLALSQTHPNKLKEFRRQDLQRRKEYKQEIKEMQERVKGRPLLLEQVAQRNAKQAADKHYTNTLHGYDVTEEFISSKAGKLGSSPKLSPSSESKQSDLEEADLGYEPIHYRKVFLDDDVDDPAEKEGGRADEESDEVSSNYQDSHHTEKDCLGDDSHYSDESYQYSDDHENYSEDSEHAADTKEQEAED